MSWIHAPQQALKVQIRWLIRRDMPEVLDIEKQSFEFAWTEEDFLCCLRQRNCIGMVAEYNHRIVGFMIYELHKAKLHVLNFAVDPEFRRQAIGSQMIEKLVDKLSQQRRQEIVLEVRESNLAAQLFFKKMGFKAVLDSAATTTTPMRTLTSCGLRCKTKKPSCCRSLPRIAFRNTTRRDDSRTRAWIGWHDRIVCRWPARHFASDCRIANTLGIASTMTIQPPRRYILTIGAASSFIRFSDRESAERLY